MEDIIEFCNVSMEYKKKSNIWALKDINFKIKKGDFHAFLGSNGAGKSTVIKILVGLNREYQGDLLVNGINVKDKLNIRNKFCYVPDHCKFPSDFTLYEFLYQSTLLSRDDKEQIKIDIDNYLKTFEMDKYKKKISNRLSAGERQKVSLIRALLEKPEVLILDEPFSNLDPKSRLQWMNVLKKVNQKYKTTIFLSSHIINDLTEYVDSATFIEKGNILYNGVIKKDELKEKYFKLILKGNGDEEIDI